MKYIEVSKKISLTREATQEELKQAFLDRIRGAFDVDTVQDQEAGFFIEGTTGDPNSMTRNARVKLDVIVKKNQENARIIVSGSSSVANSLLMLYGFMFFIVLIVGLLPGSIETNGADSGAMDALVFLIFGIFIFCDVNNKVSEPKEYLESALNSLDTEFG